MLFFVPHTSFSCSSPLLGSRTHTSHLPLPLLPLPSPFSQDHAKKCSQCLDIISSAKERQAAEANKNASILLQELDLEKVWEGLGEGGGKGLEDWWDRRLKEGVRQVVGYVRGGGGAGRWLR